MSVRQPLVIYGNGLLETSRLSHYKNLFSHLLEKNPLLEESLIVTSVKLICIKKQNVKPVKSFFKESF